jgi:hypothetical protein
LTTTTESQANPSSEKVIAKGNPTQKELESKPANSKSTSVESPVSEIKKEPRFEEEEKVVLPPEKDPPIPENFQPLNKAKTIFFEKKDDGTRLVHLLAEVCLREGQLEVLICKAMTKEHEAILRIEADAREIHFALVAAGAEPGSPVKYVPRYTPAKGTTIDISMTYHLGGELVTKSANEWVRDSKTKKTLSHKWVFAGSRFFIDPENPKATPYYCANNGEVVSLSNFPDSMLDLPVNSPKESADLIFEINPKLIPPQRTKVLVTFKPILEKK